MKSPEITLILVKPDAVAEGLTGQVLARLEKERMKILKKILALKNSLLSYQEKMTRKKQKKKVWIKSH